MRRPAALCNIHKSRAGVWERVAGLSYATVIWCSTRKKEIVMFRSLQVLSVGIGLAFAFLLIGCTKDNSVNSPSQTPDEQALTQQVMTVDSVSDYSSSDETTIDDNGLRDPDYEGLAKEANIDLTSRRTVFGDTLYPIRWGRHIRWNAIVRDYHVVMLGDTGAIVTIVKTIPGEFWIGLGYRAHDTIVIDTIIRKPFTETLTRKVQFKRIAHTDNPFRNWLPVAITPVHGNTQGTASFTISSIEVLDTQAGYDATLTDPENSWFRLGWRRGTIPIFGVGDSVTVRLTIASSNDSNEVVVLRHGITGISLTRGRAGMRLVSVTGSSGNYTRVYEKTFRANLPWNIFAARFNLVVDVTSHSSIFVNEAPYVNEFWGIPYIIAR